MDKHIAEILLAALVSGEEKIQQVVPSGIKIVILQRGWVVIGRYHEEGDYGVLTDGYVIRRWGTTEGLGQLAREGRQSDTQLERTGIIRFHRLTTVAIIDCDENVWKSL